MALPIKPRWGSVPHATTRMTHNKEYTTMYWGRFGEKKEKNKIFKKKKKGKAWLLQDQAPELLESLSYPE